MYVQPGTKLYSVADLSTVWVYAEIFQSDIGRVKVGDPASITVDSYPDQTFPARVSFIWPEMDQATRRGRVRLEIPNPELKLLLGMFVNVRLGLPLEINWRFQPPECFSPARVRSKRRSISRAGHRRRFYNQADRVESRVNRIPLRPAPR
jgi:hypothetical protein